VEGSGFLNVAEPPGGSLFDAEIKGEQNQQDDDNDDQDGEARLEALAAVQERQQKQPEGQQCRQAPGNKRRIKQTR
jgi:hypothetical protein